MKNGDLTHLFEKVQMSDMEQIKGSSYIDYFITGLGLLARRKLHNFVGRLQKLRDSGPWGSLRFHFFALGKGFNPPTLIYAFFRRR